MADPISPTLISIGLALIAACLIWSLGLTFLAWRRERDDHRIGDD
jgi:hypothetical protein